MTNRIDFAAPSSVRMSQSTNVGRTAPDTGFGTRLKTGLDTVSGAVGSGVAIAASAIPGGQVLSSAISNVSNLTSSASGAVGSQYASGVSSLGGGFPGVGGGTGVGGIPVSSGGGSALNQFGSELNSDASNLNSMLSFQMQFQRENQAYTAISNVMKTRHESAKNSISNIR